MSARLGASRLSVASRNSQWQRRRVESSIASRYREVFLEKLGLSNLVRARRRRDLLWYGDSRGGQVDVNPYHVCLHH